jgi:hypothetical protein
VIVEVVGGADETPEVRIADVEDLTRVHLALGAVTDEEADRVLRDAGLGRLEDAQTGFLDIGPLRDAARQQTSAPDWAERWEGMIAVARDGGWLSRDGGSLQVHVESAAGA